MTEPAQPTVDNASLPEAPPYTGPTHFTQVAVAKPVNAEQLEQELLTALSVEAEVTLMAEALPPYGPDNVATLTIGTVGEGPSLEAIKQVVADHTPEAVEEAPDAPAVEATPEPVFVVDPELQQPEAPAEEPAEEPVEDPQT